MPVLLFIFYSYGDHRALHSFPTRRSSDLRLMQPDELDLAALEGGLPLLREGPGALLLVLGREQQLERLALEHQSGLQRGIHRSEEHTSELQSRPHLVCRLLLEKKKQHKHT